MKLLLDENLSDRVIPHILDLYPDSQHVKALGLTKTEDARIWDYAAEYGFIIASKDSDFHQRSLVFGHPPKFIFLRIGNCSTTRLIEIFRVNFMLITVFATDPDSGILIVS